MPSNSYSPSKKTVSDLNKSEMMGFSSVSKKKDYTFGPCCIGSHVYTGPCANPHTLFDILPRCDGHQSSRYSEPNLVKAGTKEATDKDTEKNDEAAKGNQSSSSALDGGYGWFIVLGCFLSHLISGGFDRSDGVYYLHFRSKYGQSAQLTAWPGAIVATLRFVLGPVASAICNRYSVRTSVMLGGIIFSAGVYLTGYASNIYLLFLYYGLLQGVGRGLFSGPALVIVNKYFDKHRSLATGLGTSGVGVGTFAITTLTQYLFDNYDFQSIFLILSGVALHVLLVAMLFRPLSWSKKYQSISNRQHSNKKTDIPTISQTRNSISSSTLYGLQSTESLDKESSTCSSEYGHFERSTNDLLTMEDGKSRKSQEKDKSKKDDSEENYDCCLRDTFQILFPVDNIDGVKKSDKKLFEFHLLRNPSFLLFCISILLFTMAFKAAFTFMAALAESRGISPTNATLILSIAGATDTFGRIGAGIILGFPRLRSLRHIFFNFFVFAIASISFVMPLLQSFVFFCIVCGLYGILTGAYVSQKSVVLADMLGAKQISSSFGMLICFQGFGTLLGVPLSGALKDFFGNYDGVFYLGGASMAVAGILMLASNIVLWRQKRQEKDENTSSTKQ